MGHPLPRVLFCDADDSRVLDAIFELSRSGVVRPIVLGPAARTPELDELGRLGVEVLDPAAIPQLELHRAALAERRGIPLRVAERLLQRRLHLSLALLASGAADGAVLGVSSHTADALIACEMMLGLAPGHSVASSLFVLEIPSFVRPPSSPLCFTDCAVNQNPTAEQLAEIAVQAADGARTLLGIEPRVAMLSFSTHGSSVHADVEKVARATALVRARRPGLKIDGELQADAALDAEVASHKLPLLGEVAGRANVLVFPDLDAGNIGYKLVRTLARATADGVFLLGYTCPVAKLSRGATKEEIVKTAMMLVTKRA